MIFSLEFLTKWSVKYIGSLFFELIVKKLYSKLFTPLLRFNIAEKTVNENLIFFPSRKHDKS